MNKSSICIMRKILNALLISSIMLLGACTQIANKNESCITGNWDYIENSSINDYTISLKIENDTLYGIHCFIANSVNKIDCSEDDDMSIICKRNDNIFKGKFKSTFSNKNYNLTLKLKNDTLCWSLDNYDQLFFGRELKFVKNN